MNERGTGTVSFRQAHDGDVQDIVQLINAAFQVERFFKKADRTDPERTRSLMEKGKFLLAFLLTKPGPRLAGCVYVETDGEHGYLGLLSVEPALQRSGLGRKLVAAAEEFFRNAGCRFSDLTIVNLREDLPGYYRDLGYIETGTKPFTPADDLTQPAHFITMSKRIG